MGESGGLIRTFLDLGPSMESLLNLGTTTSMWRSSVYLDRLREEFHHDPIVHPPRVEPGETSDFVLYEKLTAREIEILQLLEARLSNKEISSALIVSLETVKKHAANIYRKLAVPGRREAVDRSRALTIARHSAP